MPEPRDHDQLREAERHIVGGADDVQEKGFVLDLLDRAVEAADPAGEVIAEGAARDSHGQDRGGQAHQTRAARAALPDRWSDGAAVEIVHRPATMSATIRQCVGRDGPAAPGDASR